MHAARPDELGRWTDRTAIGDMLARSLRGVEGPPAGWDRASDTALRHPRLRDRGKRRYRRNYYLYGLRDTSRGRSDSYPVADRNTTSYLALGELRYLRSMHRVILNVADEGIYGLDTNGRATFGNAATMEIFDWKPKEVIRKRSRDICHHSYGDG